MKLRIKGNSIRLRLGRSEVRRLDSDGVIEEYATFGPLQNERLVYALCAIPSALGVSARLDDGRLTVRAPADVIHEWATTDQVGIDAVERAGEHDELRILIEKDFECIDAPAHESQEDAFPHPLFGGPCQPGAGH